MLPVAAAVLSFLDAFAMLGLLFLLMTPLILLMPQPTHATDRPTAPVE